ncbi:unnamed protein product, partial [Gongylonema pulchrum]|uniref:Eyes absent homolog n=1 Tax=Gongylonema pulchrum TaxID=637853 RepID=A0A183F0J0_9BILA
MQFARESKLGISCACAMSFYIKWFLLCIMQKMAQECDYVNIEDASVDEALGDMSSSYTTIGTDTPSTSAACSTSSLLSEARSGVDWMRKLAAKYQHIRGTYNSYRNNCT